MAQSMSTGQVHALAQQTATKMLANGVTMDLAPVLDLATGPGPDAIHTDGPRSFSPVASVAESYGLAFAQGLQAGGVIPVVKHFPGEGSASANTDDASATTPPIGTLQSADLLPFAAAVRAGLPVVMVGNASVPGLTTRPAGLSSAVISGLLRQQLGFQGVVMTDALSAAAITNLGLSTPQASVDALEAGADMVLFTSTSPNTTSSQVIDAIVGAVQNGSLPAQQLDASVVRVLALKKVKLCD
jgi:beta-N-acetylhexosaminidase